MPSPPILQAAANRGRRETAAERARFTRPAALLRPDTNETEPALAESSSSSRVVIWTYAILVLTPVGFASNIVIGRAAASSADPAFLAFWRWFLAALIMLPFVAGQVRRHRAALVAALPILIFLGILGMAICGAGVYLALHHTTATNATLIYTTSPAFIVAIEMALGRRRFSPRQAAGILIATLGVAVIVARGDLAKLVTLGFNVGDIGVLAAAIAWAIYNVVLPDRRVQALPDRVSFFAIAASGAAALVPLWLYSGVRGITLYPDTGTIWLTIVALALIPSVFAYLGTQWTVRRLGPTITGMALYFLPIAGVTLAAIFLGERLHVYHLAGTLLTIGGVVTATLSGRAAQQASA